MSDETGLNGQVEETAVEDERHKNWWWADNAVIDQCGSIVGATGIAIYSLLSRHADNKSRECWPSHDHICKKLKLSKPTVIAALDALEKCGMIKIIKRYAYDGGPQLPNKYALQAQSRWTLEQGKATLLRGKESSRRGKHRGKVTLPEQNTAVQNTVVKEEQQQSGVVDFSTSLSVLSSEQQEEYTARLLRLRVSPTRAPQLIKQFPERVGQAVSWWERNPEYLNSRTSPGGAVASSIESPETYPQIYQAVSEPESHANGQKSRMSVSERRERFAPAYEAAWDKLRASEREIVEREGKDRREYLEKYHPDALALEIKKAAPQ